MAKVNRHGEYIRQERNDRLIRELEHDTYHSKRKLPEPTVCLQCGAIYRQGRWAWGDATPDAHKEMCPACSRINDKVPAGFLTLSGKFLDDHSEEIINLVKNIETREKAEHPLKRIMDIEKQEEGILITSTDPHLVRGMGEAIFHAYEGDLDIKYTEGENILRANWAR